ncbi:amino acid transporter [Amycolatopsis bartoniae]|nr:amino acid transporter [Amycolatopsis bartoniae]
MKLSPLGERNLRMNVYVTGLLWVAGAMVVGALIAYLVRRYGLDEGRPDNNDAAGQAFTIVGGLHAVVVAFVLISLFDAEGTVRDGSYQETQALVSASWAAESLPEPAHSEVPRLAHEYAETVVAKEWPRLQDGRDPGPEGWTLLTRMRSALDATELPDDDWLVNQKTDAASDLTDVYEQRQARLNAVRDNNVGTVLWFVLAIGSVIFVLLPNLFGGTKLATHVIIVSTLAATTTLLLYAIYQMQNPFAGGAKVGPDAFSQAVARLS